MDMEKNLIIVISLYRRQFQMFTKFLKNWYHVDAKHRVEHGKPLNTDYSVLKYPFVSASVPTLKFKEENSDKRSGRAFFFIHCKPWFPSGIVSVSGSDCWKSDTRLHSRTSEYIDMVYAKSDVVGQTPSRFFGVEVWRMDPWSGVVLFT
ncbi:hypothetical protein AVEN_92992-1 [Araneus ventricosus]|uniref:Uncharacterized protein n=1 Tax=Araneus ventricosus TaxID=182803 RepID=A0A4Y2JPL9_ARAVE|nr:hypothetical protein AVEN_229178-1 [Araneus ventricosus]GBM91755.1 hypothetical protein AVEN_92992-1 [Araneus ventricosus]